MKLNLMSMAELSALVRNPNTESNLRNCALTELHNREYRLSKHTSATMFNYARP